MSIMFNNFIPNSSMKSQDNANILPYNESEVDIFLNQYHESLKRFDKNSREVSYFGNLALAADLNILVSKCKAMVNDVLQDPNFNLPKDFNRINNVTINFNKSYNEKHKYSFETPFKSRLVQMEYIKNTYPDSYEKLPEFLILQKNIALLEEDKIEVAKLKNSLEKHWRIQHEASIKRKVNRKAVSGNYWNPLDYADDLQTAKYKMVKKSLKAMDECRKLTSNTMIMGVLAAPQEVLPLIIDSSIKVPLPPVSKIYKSEKQNKRDNMEDISFVIENEDRILSGVFDGHKRPGVAISGISVADFVCRSIEEGFDDMLKVCDGNVHKAMKCMFYNIQCALRMFHKEAAQKVGSTAVIAYIDKKSRLMYVASLGDSEVTIYRKIEGITKAIPASRTVDWSSPKEAKRAAAYHKKDQLYDKWVGYFNPKDLRALVYEGVNMSRAFGDLAQTGDEKNRLVISEPQITIFPVEENDTIILSSDGLGDEIHKDEIANIIEIPVPNVNIAGLLTDKVLAIPESEDNVTVIAIRIPNA